MKLQHTRRLPCRKALLTVNGCVVSVFREVFCRDDTLICRRCALNERIDARWFAAPSQLQTNDTAIREQAMFTGMIIKQVRLNVACQFRVDVWTWAAVVRLGKAKARFSTV